MSVWLKRAVALAVITGLIIFSVYFYLNIYRPGYELLAGLIVGIIGLPIIVFLVIRHRKK